MQTDIRIREVDFDTEEFRYRTPIKFGGVALDRATILNVRCTVETRDGQLTIGAGSMPLGNAWAYPSKRMSYEQTLGAMVNLAERVVTLAELLPEVGHPVDLSHALEPLVIAAADALSKKNRWPDTLPVLAALVVLSPFDAAIHDAFGKSHNLNCYHTYGPDFLPRDLGHYLGSEFDDLHLSEFIQRQPTPTLPLYHLIGALDPLTAGDVTTPIGDGLPETLAEWVQYNGLTHLKIKLNGDELPWDVERIIRVEQTLRETQAHQWCYSLDFNERCANVGYLIEVLNKVREREPAAFERIQYIEQPTKRDLKADRANTMHEAAKLKPVVIDESLVDLESLHLARDLGYSGAALKACKGQTQSLLLAAAARRMGMFLCVQDLTCPGASLIHSAGLAAHIPGVAAIEANARQYMPAANEPWAWRFPGVFDITDGKMRTGELTGLGLGAFDDSRPGN